MAKNKEGKKLLVEGMGLGTQILATMVEQAKEQGLPLDELHVLGTQKGKPLISGLVKELVKMTRGVIDSELLSLVGTVKVAGSGKFYASDHFTTNIKAVKLAWIGDNFKQHFLNKVEEPQGEVELRVSQLKKASLDKPILQELGLPACPARGQGDKAETTLANIWQLLTKQPNGESGTLLTNGYANIFYVRDAKGVLWAVGAYWYSGGWRVDAYSVESPDEWHGGDQVFSRNS